MNHHYSSLLHLPYILLSDALNASRRDAHGPHSNGLLWFSTNRVMEATAFKRSAPPIRFLSALDRIGDWQAAARSVGFSSAVMRRLERSGRQMGATPSEWRAMVGNMDLSDVDRIEVRIAGGWHGVERAALHVEDVAGGAVLLHGPGGLVATVVRHRTADGYFAYATNSDSCGMDGLMCTALRAAS